MYKQFYFFTLLYINLNRNIKEMPRPKKEKTPDLQKKKTKKIQKAQKQIPVDNKISIKKLSNQKEIVADFPLIPVQNGKMAMSIPVFRKDKLDFTPGFCLPDQFTPHFISQQQVLQEYRMNSQCNEIDVQNIKQPKPSSRNSYCTICKVRFQDYKQHVQLESHLTKMRASIYNKFISQLSQNKRLQRFLNNSQIKPQTQTGLCEEKYPLRQFLEEQNMKFERVATGDDSRQLLYNLVKQDLKKAKCRSEIQLVSHQNQSNLFDVLQ